jgi:uncharacterized NAD(P)/FAD-binding protein YdhS
MNIGTPGDTWQWPGGSSRSLFAVGPAARGAPWDITAVAEIRRQRAGLAEFLTRERVYA